MPRILARILFLLLLTLASHSLAAPLRTATGPTDFSPELPRAEEIPDLQAKAAKNDPQALNRLGLAYLAGVGVAEDREKAMALLEKAALKGSGEAAAYLGAIYMTGVVVPENMVEAARWFKRGDALEYPLATLMLAALYLQGAGVEQDEAAGIALMRKAAERGSADACVVLGSYYGKAMQDAAESRRWFTRGAELGNAEAAYALGEIYLNGTGVAADPEKARANLQQAAAQRYPEAMLLLGRINDDGIGQSRDVATAILWYERTVNAIAALQDDSERSRWQETATAAQLDLDRLTCLDQRVELNPLKRRDACARVVEEGDLAATVTYGRYFRAGTLGERDAEAAAILFRIAADQGDVEGQFLLAGMLASGEGGRRSPGEARSWYEKAAAQGHTGAKSALQGLKKK